MRTLEIGKSSTVAIVDDEDYPALREFRWHSAIGSNGNQYACRIGWDEERQAFCKRIWMHRVLLLPAEGFDVDHINRNGLDNRRENLRVATRSQNMCNQVRALGKTGYRGVGTTKGGRFTARCKFQQKRIHIGVYSTAEQASNAMVERLKQLHGEFFLLRENEAMSG